MYAVEFETDIKGEFIAVQDYEQLINKHVRVIILVEEPRLDKSQKNKIDELNHLINIRKSFPKIDPNIDIEKLCNEVNSDIF